MLRHVSASGMSRIISLYKIDADGDPRRLDGYASKALGLRIKSSGRCGEGLVAGGCGMDMGFHLVYNLGRALFPDGFKLAKGQRGRNGDTSGHDNDGGYALTQKWL